MIEDRTVPAMLTVERALAAWKTRSPELTFRRVDLPNLGNDLDNRVMLVYKR